MSKEIIVTITPEGELSIETKGFRGKGCKKASEFLSQGFGNLLETKKTSEFFQAEVSAEVVSNKN